MKTPIANLEGELLDYWVAMAEGLEPQPMRVLHGDAFAWTGSGINSMCTSSTHRFSSNWALAGPIIQRESITVLRIGIHWTACTEFATKVRTGLEPDLVGNGLPWPGWTGDFLQNGSTPLQAAMRTYVASKLGDSVDVP